jgi:uncharacterized protein with FMN-binding domain
MRRAIPVVVVTAGSLALLANFHTSPSGSTAPGTGTGLGSASAASTTTTVPATTVPSSSLPTTSVPPTAASATRSIDGPAVDTDYGTVQVRITLRGSKLIDVRALQLPAERARSERISQVAGPILRSEALQAQSANIDMVSGASYTSQGYIQSLQGALDSARQ